jgi:hypothetical protein
MQYILDDPYKEWEVTLKLDGSSITIYSKDCFPGVCSRNLDLKLNKENSESNTFVKTARKSGWIDFLLEYEAHTGRAMAVQGELVGPGIQDNRLGLSEHRIYIFDVYDINGQRYLTPVERLAFINYVYETMSDNRVNINHVPLLVAHKYETSTATETTLDDLGVKTVEDALYLANRIENTAEGTNIIELFDPFSRQLSFTGPFEGVVFKATDGDVSFKAINNDYLLGTK